MTLSPGTLFGPYRVTALIGVGGMGEVYRGTDTRLKRDVAIKVLPPLFASDVDRLARFQREAEVLASLNHANIAHIYGIEQSADTTALAMELVEGETLAERIARGPIALDDALVIARQIAEALEAAHARGIVHRDLKPGNVKLAPDGAVKVLDFGIAKALDARTTGAATTSATQTGVVLGTPAYMSPEQARGKSVDERADIWAFGCVLYEMLTGRPVFEGDDVTLAAPKLNQRTATVDRLAKVPGSVSRTIELCLEPDVRKRIRHIGDARLALEGAFETAAPSPAQRSTRGRGAWITVLAVTGSAAIALFAIPGIRHLREAPPLETRLDIATSATDEPASFALSPDGRQIVFVATGSSGRSQLFLRSFLTAKAQPLPGTEGAFSPFWSPNSRSIGFFADSSLKRVEVDGGAPQTLAAAINGSGGTWNADGVIVFAPSLTGPLMRVTATGEGVATSVLALRPGDSGHVGPHFLPDGFRFLFTVLGHPDTEGIHIGDLDGSTSTRLTTGDGNALYFSTGWMLWVRAAALVAQRLDQTQMALTGERLTLADGVPIDYRRFSGISVSPTGLVAYRAGAGSQRRLMWIDRSGSVQGALGDAEQTTRWPRLTPDARRSVVTREMQGNYDLWLLDGTRTKRITFDPARDDYPILSPDGATVVFRSRRTGAGDLYTTLVDRTDSEQLLRSSNEVKVPTSWSADGRFLMFQNTSLQSGADLWVLPMQGDRTPYVFLQTQFREAHGAFSPDGRWVAYHTDESGHGYEIFVRPFVEPGKQLSVDQRSIPIAGGTFPAWRTDGSELYYLDPTGAMMAVPITVTGDELVPGAPMKLFDTRIVNGGGDMQQGRQYDVAADGRFLINSELDDDVGTPITLIQNWNPDTKAGE